MIDESLKRERRENGIDLVWDDTSEAPNATIRTDDGSPVLFATPIAVTIDGGGFLKYAERDTGINLVWSASPEYQWEITGGPPGDPVPANQPIGLLNTDHGDHLIYDRRPSGINLRWYADWGISVAFAPQPMFAGYPPLPIPNGLRSPGREAAQVEIQGEARVVSLFHGSVDDELDWHVYVGPSGQDRSLLAAHMRAHARGAGGVTDRTFDSVYCELMVLDGWDNTWTDEFFYSADVRRAFSLTRPAWDYSVEAGQDQGSPSLDVTGESRLSASGARVRLQGAFVNDAAHGFQPEIHPLDSIAFARGSDGQPLRISEDDPAWPESELTWRVAVFTNSQTHRINGADYVKQDRVTTWYLPVPRAGNPQTRPTRPGTQPQLLGQVTVTMSEPGFINGSAGRGGLDEARPSPARYVRHRVISERHRIVKTPLAGRQLQVRVHMDRPNDRWGGMFLADYRVRVGPPVVLQGVD